MNDHVIFGADYKPVPSKRQKDTEREAGKHPAMDHCRSNKEIVCMARHGVRRQTSRATIRLSHEGEQNLWRHGAESMHSLAQVKFWRQMHEEPDKGPLTSVTHCFPVSGCQSKTRGVGQSGSRQSDRQKSPATKQSNNSGSLRAA